MDTPPTEDTTDHNLLCVRVNMADPKQHRHVLEGITRRIIHSAGEGGFEGSPLQDNTKEPIILKAKHDPPVFQDAAARANATEFGAVARFTTDRLTAHPASGQQIAHRKQMTSHHPGWRLC